MTIDLIILNLAEVKHIHSVSIDGNIISNTKPVLLLADTTYFASSTGRRRGAHECVDKDAHCRRFFL